jgi:S-adenosyl-L-methionine hydrolase (adenosine-forming)
MRQDGQYYVAPDNGVLSLIRSSEDAVCVVVDLEAMTLPATGRAFLVQNRLAPIAAAIANGQSMESLGTVAQIKEFRWGEPSYTENSLRGVILHVDHFGNAITNVQKDEFMRLKGDRSFQVFIRNLRIQRIVGSYSDAAKGDSLALFSDNGHLEIAIREGSAAKLLGLKVQDMITIEFYG